MKGPGELFSLRPIEHTAIHRQRPAARAGKAISLVHVNTHSGWLIIVGIETIR